MTGSKFRLAILQIIMCEFFISMILCEKSNLIMYILSITLGMIGSGRADVQLKERGYKDYQ